MHSTIAFSGGLRYRPATSISFSSNFGSLDSLNVSTRCGFKPRAAHTRCTVAGDTPAFAAIVRHDQWGLAVRRGMPCQVYDLVDLLLRDWRTSGRAPARTFPSFAKPSSANRARHARTVAGFTDLRGDPHIRHTIGRQQQRLGPLNLPMRRGPATAKRPATLLVDRPT